MNFELIDVHPDGRVAVSSGPEIWIVWPEGPKKKSYVKNYINLKKFSPKNADACYIKIVGKFLVVLDGHAHMSNVSIFEIFHSESSATR
jgi:hypothetical protein